MPSKSDRRDHKPEFDEDGKSCAVCGGRIEVVHIPWKRYLRHGRAPKPRGDCGKCGRKGIALMSNGRLWPHMRPGWGMWEDEGRCT